jgi:hypothetical protein
MQRASTTALLAGVVDYAGLFPPAGLPMADAVTAYRQALAGPAAWMLGRFVAPAARLEELRASLDDATGSDAAWRVSAIVRDGSEADLGAIADFNTNAAGRARVDSVETKPEAIAGIDWIAARGRAIGEVYVEVAPRPEMEAWLARVALHGLRAKVRTGGLTAEAFPPAAALAAFLAAAVRHDVPFKATAGLHHAVRGDYRLTYEAGSASAPMYGYLNVLLATAALQAGEPVATAEALLRRSDTEALAFADGTVRWAGREFTTEALRQTRARRLISFGSCSFREPVEEFDALAAR